MNQSSLGFYRLLSTKENQVEDAPTSTFSEIESAGQEGETELEGITDVADSTSKGSASVLDTTFNLVSFVLGVGFLALPYAVRKGGLAALVSLLVTPSLLWYTGKILVDCLYETDDRNHKVRVRASYRDIGEACFPRLGGVLVDAVLYIGLLTIAIAYLILGGSLLVTSIPSLALTQALWTCLVVAIILPTVFIKRLADIAWLSFASAAVILVTFVVVIWSAVRSNPHWDVTDTLFWDNEGSAAALGIVFYSFEVNLVIIDVEKSMSDRTKLGRAYACALLLTSVGKTTFALCAFLSYNSETREAIVENLPAGPIRITIATLIVINIILTYVVPFHAFIQNLENSKTAEKLISKVPPLLWFVGVRIGFVALTLVITVCVSRFAAWLSFSGSLVSPCISIIFPSLFHLKLKYKQLSALEITTDVVLLFSAIGLLGILLYSSSKILLFGEAM